MIKLIAVLAVMFSIDAAAQFEVGVEPAVVGRGYEHLGEAREFMRYLDGGENLDYQDISMWRARAESFSMVFADPDFPYPICYPQGIKSDQLADSAASYLINNPDRQRDRLHVIVWTAHQNYFGLQDEDDCWMNIEE
jgi:hypothetical protein